jgi:hypothetical protein
MMFNIFWMFRDNLRYFSAKVATISQVLSVFSAGNN